MFTGPSYQAISQHGDLYIYTDSMRRQVKVYKGQAHNRAIINALYSQGLSGADRAARNNGK